MEPFKSALRAFLLESCALLAGEPIRKRLWTRIVRMEGGGTSFPQEMRNDFSESLTHFRTHMIDGKMLAFDLLIQALRNEPEIRDRLMLDASGKSVPETSEPWWLENMVVAPLLSAYVSRANGFQFEQSIFNEVFDFFRHEVESPNVTVTELSPLLNVETESTQIQVDDDILLRQLSTEELEEWLNSQTPYSPQPLSSFETIELRSAIEVVHEQDRHSPLGCVDTREKLSRLLTPLRLLTDASPRIAFTTTRTSGLLRFGTSWGLSIPRHGPRAKIERSQESQLVELYKSLSSGPNLAGVRLALARWNSATDRLTEEDKLIDYWVALESLFVPDTVQELSYRSALRIAVFLGSNGAERKQIYEQMRGSYSLRSEIVHGSIRKSRRKVTSAELTSLTRSCLRRSILKILKSSERFTPSNFEIRLLST